MSDLMSKVSDTTEVPNNSLVAGLSLILGSILTRIFGFQACGQCFSFTYLVYKTFHVQETGNTADKIHMLTYWAFYGVWTLFDAVTAGLFSWSPWAPQIELAKLFLLALCLIPQTQGAQQIYYHVIHKGIKEYETQIDSATESIKTSVSQIMTEVGQLGLEFVLEFLGSMGINIFQLLSKALGGGASSLQGRSKNDAKKDD